MVCVLQRVFLIGIFISCSLHAADLRYIQYDGYQLVVDCDKRSAIQFSYTVGPDTGDLNRRSSYSEDPDVSSDCKQLSSKSYSDSQEPSDRGHLVPANHLDNLKIGIHQSNYVTNVLPQARNMNRGAWLLTEEVIECHRENSALYVYGGPIYGADRSNDTGLRFQTVKNDGKALPATTSWINPSGCDLS